MKRPVYKNYKSGKHYTFAPTDVFETDSPVSEENAIFTVFVDDAKYDAAEVKIDKNGKVYKLMECTKHTTKAGHNIFRA